MPLAIGALVRHSFQVQPHLYKEKKGFFFQLDKLWYQLNPSLNRRKAGRKERESTHSLVLLMPNEIIAIKISCLPALTSTDRSIALSAIIMAKKLVYRVGRCRHRTSQSQILDLGFDYTRGRVDEGLRPSWKRLSHMWHAGFISHTILASVTLRDIQRNSWYLVSKRGLLVISNICP